VGTPLLRLSPSERTNAVPENVSQPQDLPKKVSLWGSLKKKFWKVN